MEREKDPAKDIYLAHCAISPLFDRAAEREKELVDLQRDGGVRIAQEYVRILEQLHRAAAALLASGPDNISCHRNTTEGLSLIANGYPFAAGDRIISYIHEYPANHYPWKLQETRGVSLDLLPDRAVNTTTAPAGPCGWDMNDLEAMVTDRTRMVAVSHVQFTSGFAADLRELGAFCHSRNIDLVIDAAQSFGCLPIYPEEWHIAAIATSGWKWLLGPVGTGLLYTSAAFRDKLGHVMVGAESMQQGIDYLDHRWQPHRTAKRFEYSTAALSLAGALEVCLRECHLQQGIEHIWTRVSRHIDQIVAGLDRDRFTPVLFDARHRSGILSLHCPENVDLLAQHLLAQGVVTSPRAGYLRLAPHFYLSDAEILQAIDILNTTIAGL
jgi:cysteine desulfurase/selenocysteine lyase